MGRQAPPERTMLFFRVTTSDPWVSDATVLLADNRLRFQKFLQPENTAFAADA
jgi:hypothetical protein